MRIFFVGFGRALAPVGVVCFLAGILAESADVTITGGILLVFGVLAWFTPLRSTKPLKALTLTGLIVTFGGYLGMISSPVITQLFHFSKKAVDLTSLLIILAGMALIIIDIVRNRN